MNWKKSIGSAIGDVKGKIDDAAEKRRLTNEENKRIQDEEEKEYLEYTKKVTDLLDKFEISNFDEFLKRYLNVENNVVEIHDKKNDTTYQRPMARKEYMEDIRRFLDSKEITFDHLKDFALKAKIIAPSFFGIDSKEVGNERENPMFKEIVKLVITPMISSLSLMENANSESEVMSLGLSVIMLNLGMYLGVPAVLIVGIRKRI